MTQLLPFREVLDAADQLSSDDQQALIAILHRRLVQAGRERIVTDVQSAREEFAAGRCQPTTPDELMREILS